MGLYHVEYRLGVRERGAEGPKRRTQDAECRTQKSL